MKILRIGTAEAEELVPLAAGFRAALCALRGVVVQPDPEAAREELREFLERGFPVFAAEEDGRITGYMVCRIEEPCVWVEHLYVCPEDRRRGTASRLFREAEKLAESRGEETVFNFVHPNNDAVIGFLRSRGYTVVNLIEVRKPYRGEKRSALRVGDHDFEY